MRVLPIRKYELNSRLNSDELISNIQEKIGDEDFLKLGGSPANLLEGSTTNSSFRIKRSINYHNPAIPVAIGKISNNGSTTKINVLIRPTLSVLIFFIMWITISIVLTLVGLIIVILNSKWILLVLGSIFLTFGISFLNPNGNKEYDIILNIIKELSEIKKAHNN
jgi:hypothetical protein